MSPSPVLPPPPPPRAKSGASRGFLPPLFRNPETRSVEVGIAGTILVHLLLLLFLPQILQTQGAKSAAAAHRKPKPKIFNIQMVPAPLVRVPPIPKKFVEANPDANNNRPDRTNNFAAQNQKVAQEKPNPKGNSDMPTLDGRTDVQSTQIVSCSLAKQQKTAAPTPPAPVTPPAPPIPNPRQEQNPLTGAAKQEGDSKTGFGSNVAQSPTNAKDIPQKVDGVRVANNHDSVATAIPHIDPKHPQPRLKLEQQVRPAIFSKNAIGTSNIGLTASDAFQSSYGEYLQRMIEDIQIAWDNILEHAGNIPEGTTVNVRFRLSSDGKIEILETKSTSSEQGQQACVAAIGTPAPYEKWTPDMIALLGDSQELGFMFFYE